MVKSFLLDGKRKRLRAEVPEREIRRWVGNFHVGTPDSEIITKLNRKIACAPHGPGEVWTPAIIRSAGLWALKCHRDNLGVYCHVMRGSR